MQETWDTGREDPLEEGMATHSWQPNIHVWRIPMDRGVWRATVHGVAKESDKTEATEHVHKKIASVVYF